MFHTMSSFSLFGGCVSTVAILAVYSKSIKAVGAGRHKFKVAPPSTEGPEEFQRLLRAQQNTLEFLPIVLSLVWMAAVLLPQVGPVFALVGGLGWAFFRLQYIDGYAESAEGRLPGFYRSRKCLVKKKNNNNFLLLFGSFNVVLCVGQELLAVGVVVGALYQLAETLD